MSRSLGCLFEVLETLLVTLVFFLAVQLFVAQPFHVEQPSMENTLMPDQYVLVDKISPRFTDYQRGDIVVFNPPSSWASGAAGTPYIKRVIAVASDTVDIHGGHVFVDGKELSEPYVYEGQATEPLDAAKHVWKLTAGQLFVMGDHRADSQDSRVFGPIDKASVIGRALIRYWPLANFGPLSQPNAPISSATP
ncbi:MAG TPA: signal peptidase I [Candidatus Limnocylindrales bacterium]|jgi:signal peptidase I